MHQLILKIHGKVQGVYFRETTVKKANELGLVGYVKNMPDSTVEILAEGEEGTLKKLLEWCKIGPQEAKVERVEDEWGIISELSFNDFEIEF